MNARSEASGTRLVVTLRADEARMLADGDARTAAVLRRVVARVVDNPCTPPGEQT